MTPPIVPVTMLAVTPAPAALILSRRVSTVSVAMKATSLAVAPATDSFSVPAEPSAVVELVKAAERTWCALASCVTSTW